MRNSFVWKKVLFSQNNPNTPTPRKACSMNVWKNKVFVFGGETGFRIASNDLYTFSFQDGWIKHNLENTPSPRSGHSSIIYEGSMYVFGGDDLKQDAQYHNFYALNLKTLSWRRIYANKGTTDDLIKPKSFHSSILHQKRMIIYGGRTLMRPNVYFINHNVWSYNFETNSWEEMRCRGELPAARFGHSASIIKNEMYIFGGMTIHSVFKCIDDLFVLNLDTLMWKSISIEGIPSPRRLHTSFAFDTYLYIFGGLDDSSHCFHDFYELDTQSMTLKNLAPQYCNQKLPVYYSVKLDRMGRKLILLESGSEFNLWEMELLPNLEDYYENSLKQVIKFGSFGDVNFVFKSEESKKRKMEYINFRVTKIMKI